MNWLIMKQWIFLLRTHEGTLIKSHIVKFFSIIINLDKIEIKIEDDGQALLLVCFLPSSYRRFRKTIIYEGKSIIKVNEIKERLLNKEKIDNQLTGESHRDEFRQAHFSKERVIMKVSRVTQNTRIGCATGVRRRGPFELIVGVARRNNKMLISLNWLKGIKINVMIYVMFYLLQIYQSAIKIDRLLTLDVHNISVAIGRYSSHTPQFKEKRSLWKILPRAR